MVNEWRVTSELLFLSGIVFGCIGVVQLAVFYSQAVAEATWLMSPTEASVLVVIALLCFVGYRVVRRWSK
jgi:hypothetical protein